MDSNENLRVQLFAISNQSLIQDEQIGYPKDNPDIDNVSREKLWKIGSQKDSNRYQGDFKSSKVPKIVTMSPLQHGIDKTFHPVTLLCMV